MLVLSRKPGEKLCLGADITITVVEVKGNRVRIGIEAPDHVHVLRGELREAIIEVVDKPDAPAAKSA